jgi:hypothetical protein
MAALARELNKPWRSGRLDRAEAGVALDQQVRRHMTRNPGVAYTKAFEAVRLDPANAVLVEAYEVGR